MSQILIHKRSIQEKLKERGHRLDPPYDLAVGWGRRVTEPARRTLNLVHIAPKLVELDMLQRAGVKVPRFATTISNGGPHWLPRGNHHIGGGDFVDGHWTNNRRPDYYVEYIETVKEYRIHVLGENLVAARKVQREGVRAHPWVRSWDFGWRFSYRTAAPVEAVKAEAVKAVQALGYDFGAVDIAVRPDGTPVVWEVNSAPALEVPVVYEAYLDYFESQIPR